MQSIRRYLRSLSPYTCLLLVAAPLVIAEPLKLGAVFICGKGHWVIGLIVMLFAYAVSVLLVERLFKIVKPKLLTLRWFKAIWNWIVFCRNAALDWLHLSYTPF